MQDGSTKATDGSIGGEMPGSPIIFNSPGISNAPYGAGRTMCPQWLEGCLYGGHTPFGLHRARPLKRRHISLQPCSVQAKRNEDSKHNTCPPLSPPLWHLAPEQTSTCQLSSVWMKICHDHLLDDDDADEKYIGSSLKWVVMSRFEIAIMDTNSRSRICPQGDCFESTS